MAPGVLTLHGFLGTDDRKLADIMAEDALCLSRAGVAAGMLADRLEALSRAGANLMEEEVRIEDRFLVKVRDDRGVLPCPWGDGRFEKGDTEVLDTRTQHRFRWNPLTLHMVRSHGFFSGRGSEFRLEPADLIDGFGLRAGPTASLDEIQRLCSRRSIRRYTPAIVPDDMVTAVLTAAMHAPSAGNQQPWHFLVIRERLLLDAVPDFHPYAGMLKGCSVAVLVCGDERLEKHKGYWIQDCSAAVENLLLAAHFIGLGAVWLGVYPDPQRVDGCRRLFNLPAEVTPLALVPMGFFEELPDTPQRFHPERIHLNTWPTSWPGTEKPD